MNIQVKKLDKANELTKKVNDILVDSSERLSEEIEKNLFIKKNIMMLTMVII